MSPAILTETVWALAQEKPAIIPDRVVIVTTISGHMAVKCELFGPSGVWEQLRASLAAKRLPIDGKLRFGTTPDDIRVFTRGDARGRSVELDDIRTPADNEAAADFLLDALRPFTENPDVRLVCSLAGGRKTMGALLYACLSLIGRDDDRLTHVLVNEPFDDPRLQPRFYFPTVPPQRHHLPSIGNRRSKIENSSSARIELADVPFVPLRNLFPRELGRSPGYFTALVQEYRKTLGHLNTPPRVEFAEEEPIAHVDGVPVRLSVTSLALLYFLVNRFLGGQPAFPSFRDAVDPFRQFLASWGANQEPFHFRNNDSVKNFSRSVTEENLRKLALNIKRTLIQAGVPSSKVQDLVPRRGHFGIRVRLP